MWRKPVLIVNNSAGKNILPGLSGLWVHCEIVEQAGGESDTAEIVCVGSPSKVPLPVRGAQFSILGGWQDERPVMQGVFTFQKAVLRGDPEQGDTIALQLRAADYVDKLKAHATKHYDDTTYGEIIQDIARQAGLQAAVDDAVKKIKVPYWLRWQQSHIDACAEVSEIVGAVCKPAGGKLIAVKRGGGKSASGKALAPIEIMRRRAFGYEIEIEPRPEVGHVAAGWHDAKSGRRKVVKHKTGRDGPIHTLPHPYRSEDEAKEAAKAHAYEMGHATGTGWFLSPGLPHAHAEARVVASGFGWPVDGIWKAESVRKRWEATGGFTTIVEVGAGDAPKGKK